MINAIHFSDSTSLLTLNFNFPHRATTIDFANSISHVIIRQYATGFRVFILSEIIFSKKDLQLFCKRYSNIESFTLIKRCLYWLYLHTKCKILYWIQQRLWICLKNLHENYLNDTWHFTETLICYLYEMARFGSIDVYVY